MFCVEGGVVSFCILDGVQIQAFVDVNFVFLSEEKLFN